VALEEMSVTTSVWRRLIWTVSTSGAVELGGRHPDGKDRENLAEVDVH
jgi:hypothetical protein